MYNTPKERTNTLRAPFRESRTFHKGLFSTPKAPKPPAPVRMPDRDDPQLQESARRRREQRAATGGRQGNLLTDMLRTVSGSRGNLGA